MSKLVIRHCLSEANNTENYGTPAFGNPNAPLMPRGCEQAQELGELLVVKYGIELKTEPVAVSMMRRTHETAIHAGFRHLTVYPELNEEKGGMSNTETRQALNDKYVHPVTLAAARKIIEFPPEEDIIIMHAYLIAAMGQELGVHQDQRFTPRFGEIREFPIG